jgi:hypothetical protein
VADSSGVLVHLKALRDFAQQLDKQLDLVEQPARELRSLKDERPLPLGDFDEAQWLAVELGRRAEAMDALVAKVTDSIKFASGITTVIADNYERLNTEGAQAFRNVAAAVPANTGTAPAPAGSLAPADVARFSVPVPTQGGTVYYYNGSTTVPVKVTITSQG